MLTINQENAEEKLAASNTLRALGEATSSALDKFSMWAIAAAAAVVAAMLASLSEVTQYLSKERIGWVMLAFVAACATAVIARYIGMLVSATTEVAERMNEQRGDDEGPADVNFDIYFAEYAKGFYWHLRWFVKRELGLALGGDIARSGRLVAKLAQWHGLVVFLQLLLTLGALAILATGFAF